MTLLVIALVVSAIYSGGSWLYRGFQAYTGRIIVDEELEAHTFHLGLCFILSIGFLGLLLK